MVNDELSSERAHALFDILSHHEAYQELRDFRVPGTLSHFGAPFKADGEESQTPLVHALFSAFVIPLPGLQDVSTDFWQAKCQEVVEDFAKADLSESYEAGYIGIRKTLATAGAAIIEAPARGYYGGFMKKELSRKVIVYDTANPNDVAEGFNDFLQCLVYEDLIEKIFVKAAETESLQEHDPLVQVAHEQILLVLASFIYFIFFISPDGHTLLTMIKRANALVPYIAIRQTLRVGNAATMINGMMKIFLTKMTLNSVTTFLGITNPSDSGWNLLQTIISTVVNWDTSSLKQRSADIAKNADGPSKSQRELIKSYVQMGREEHDKCRMMSEAKSEPIVVTVMDEYGGDELLGYQIPFALEYLSIHVSIRDRNQITDILCSRHPDLVTQAIYECIAAYDPVIRALHKAVDLSGTVGDLQVFLDDLLKLAPASKAVTPPAVGDIVKLLRKHQRSCHSFIHQVCKNGPELSSWYKEYAKRTIANFRVSGKQGVGSESGAGRMTTELKHMILKLSEKQRAHVLEECDTHAAYLASFSIPSKIVNTSITVEQLLALKKPEAEKSGTSRPPSRESLVNQEVVGRVKLLARWQDYINETAITPAHIDGPVRHGGDRDIITTGRGGSTPTNHVTMTLPKEDDLTAKMGPSTVRTVELLGSRFKDILRGFRQ